MATLNEIYTTLTVARLKLSGQLNYNKIKYNILLLILLDSPIKQYIAVRLFKSSLLSKDKYIIIKIVFILHLNISKLKMFNSIVIVFYSKIKV